MLVFNMLHICALYHIKVVINHWSDRYVWLTYFKPGSECGGYRVYGSQVFYLVFVSIMSGHSFNVLCICLTNVTVGSHLNVVKLLLDRKSTI
jgi:hypothetical protein